MKKCSYTAKVIKTTAVIGLCLVGFTGCSGLFESEPPLTQLQIRELQSRIFPTSDFKSVLKEMVNVLQDEAYIVKQANVEVGLLSAEKEVDIENKTASVLFAISDGLSGVREKRSYDKRCMIEVSANISQFGEETRVRVNFQKKIFDNNGQVTAVSQVRDPKYYQMFFAKVSEGLFIQDAKI